MDVPKKNPMKEKMPIQQGYKEQRIPTNIEKEDRLRSLAGEITLKIRKIVRMPNAGIDDEGMASTVDSIKKDLTFNRMLNWDDVFTAVNEEIEKEIESLNLQKADQKAAERIARTKAAWKYVAEKVLSRGYKLKEASA